MADKTFTRRLVKQLLLEGKRQVRPLIPGKKNFTLRRSLQAIVRSSLVGALFIPHYWAVYVHDGRGGFGPKRGTFLVYWDDPSKDPRLRASGGQTPARARRVPRLTKSQFRAALAEWSRAQDTGRDTGIRIRRRVGPVRADLFFSNQGRGGMVGFDNEANRVGELEFRRFSLKFLKRALGLRGTLPVPGQGIALKLIKDSVVIKI